MKVSGHGVEITVPEGWEARISRRGSGPVLHIATFPLLADDGDFGGAATGRMRLGDTFAALVEYVDPKLIRPGVGLFSATRPPILRVADFSPSQLQATRAGHLGWQRFFTEADRTCCLYAVIRPGAERPDKLVKRLAGALETLHLA